MAAVTVFVDDGLTGRFPEVCAKTGRASDGWMTLEAEVRKRRATGWLWGAALFMLAIPPLWPLLFFYVAVVSLVSIVMAVIGEETLTVQLPWTEDTHHDSVASLGRQRAALGMAFGGLLGAPLAFFLIGRWVLGGLLLGIGIVAAIVALVRRTELNNQLVLASLDASRRWVRLDGVHPDFVAAVLAHNDTPARPV